MLIDTFDEETIYNSISELLGIKKECLEYFITQYGFKYITERKVENVNLVEFKRFFRKRKVLNYLNLENLNEITISHLTTRTDDIEYIKEKPLYNLFEVLLKDTALRKFMIEKGVEFRSENAKIVTLFDGNIVDWSIYYNTTWGPTARMINNRLEGNSKRVVDKCINGFLFNGQIYKNTNVSHIKRMPEIAENILRVLRKNGAVQEWSKKSKPYVVIFQSKIEDIIFDENNKTKLNNKQKKYQIFKYCLYFLACAKYGDWSESDNPIIRLKNEISVSANNIVKVTLIANQ